MPHELLGSRTIYNGQFVNVRIATVNLGASNAEREVVEEREGVLIIPVTSSGKIVLVEQSRHLFGVTLEVPAGAINPGETPVQAAARELHEEAGLSAMRFELLSAHVNGVHMEGRNYCFLATGLEECDAVGWDADEEFLGRKAFTFEEVARLMDDGRIPDVRNRACLWRAQLRMMQTD